MYGMRFWRQYSRIKLSLNEFERLFLRFGDMYSPECRWSIIAKTDSLLLHVQEKMLNLEKALHLKSNFEIVKGSHAKTFKLLLHEKISAFKCIRKRYNFLIQFELKSPLKGEERDYMRIKIALSRLIPLWKSSLLSNNCTILNLEMHSKGDLNDARQAL